MFVALTSSSYIQIVTSMCCPKSFLSVNNAVCLFSFSNFFFFFLQCDHMHPILEGLEGTRTPHSRLALALDQARAAYFAHITEANAFT